MRRCRIVFLSVLTKRMSIAATGLRHVLVAAALLALVHGLVLRTLYPHAPHYIRAGRPHDGHPHVPMYSPMYEQQFRSKEDEIREMFEFAKEPSDWRRCHDQVETLNTPPALVPKPCPSGGPEASYIPAAMLNSYQDDAVMNGGMMDGSISAFEHAGFGGATL